MANSGNAVSGFTRPAEALSLVEALKCSPSWREWLTARDEYKWLLRPKISGFVPSGEDRKRAGEQARRALNACIAEFFAKWRSGSSTVMGRLEHSSAYVTIPPAAAGRLFFNWTASSALEIDTGRRIRDICVIPALSTRAWSATLRRDPS